MPRQPKNKIVILGCLFLLYSITGSAQSGHSADGSTGQKPASDTLFTFVKTIPGNFLYLNVDVLDNIYLINSGYQLKKLNGNGDSVAVFNDVKKYGNPSFIDVNNPLKLLVYYRNFATVVVLDRFLTQRNSINLRKENIFSVKAIATSYDNNIWLFDEQDYKLKKIDEDGKLLLESADMRQLAETAPSPRLIIDSDNFVYLYDEDKGFYIFDYYGALKNNLPFSHWENVSVSGNKLIGILQNNLCSYELKSLDLKFYPLPQFFKGYESIKAVNGKVYVLKKDGVDIYTIR